MPSVAVPVASLTNDNATFGWDRLTLLNNPIEQWSSAAAEKWGKFDSRPGPLICWEPSDQIGVQGVYKTFAASGSDHADGVLIASNTDPAMFQVQHPLQCPYASDVPHQIYAAGQSLAALNSPLPLHVNTTTGHVRIATAIVGIPEKFLHDPLAPAARVAADGFNSAGHFTVVCTLSEGLDGTAIDYVSE